TISTGSTLLDLAISGGRKKGGGIPAGILVEIFGPAGSGKTVLLCEIAGGIKRGGGSTRFNDPEARLNKQFAKLFDLDVDEIEYSQPNTIPEVFLPVRSWNPEGDAIHGIFTDSLAALSTNLEMDKDEGDKMGMRRAKEFSEELRKTCRILAQKNFLMVASNQLRQDVDPLSFTKYTSPGGLAIGFYSSLRLRLAIIQKIVIKKTVGGKEVKRVVGIRSTVEVFKSSVWSPYRTAPITIYFDYGIDDIRQNLQFIKTYTKNEIYMIGDKNLDKSMDVSIAIIEKDNLEKKLKEEVIDLWEFIESKFEINRKPKVR
ncbi:hypothetical protein LCGC14_2325310, partial [marine sediment metagenome]